MSTTTRNKIALAFARYKELRVSDVEAMVRAMEKPQGPVVIDLPFASTGGREQEAGIVVLDEAKRCVEIKADGRRCEDPRDEGSERCMRHTQWFRTNAAVMGFRCPDDAVGLQEFLVRTLALVAGGTFTAEMGAAIVRVATLMQKNMREYRREMEEARWERRVEGGGRREDVGKALTTEGTEGTEDTGQEAGGRREDVGKALTTEGTEIQGAGGRRQEAERQGAGGRRQEAGKALTTEGTEGTGKCIDSSSAVADSE